MINNILRNELLKLKERDISTRRQLVENGELSSSEYHPAMKKVHEKNNSRIKEIISEFGWPKESEVGEDGADAVWILVQHAILEPLFQEKCIALLQLAVDSGEANAWYLAYLQDRVRVQQGKLQVYGTQHEVKGDLVIPLPTEDPDNVNERRSLLELWSQEEHTKHLQNDYNENQRNKLKSGG